MSSDLTLAGYFAEHERAPAFEGADGEAYSVDIFADDEPEPGKGFGAALLFIRWSRAGDAPTGHLESEFLAWGSSPARAREEVGKLTLREVKGHLDRLITSARDLDW